MFRLYFRELGLSLGEGEGDQMVDWGRGHNGDFGLCMPLPIYIVKKGPGGRVSLCWIKC